MTEDVKKPEDTQAAPQNQQQVVAAVTPTEPAPEIKSESNKENWKKFREEREQERKARAEAERIAQQKQQEAEALKAAMESILNKPQQQSPYDQPQFNVDNDQDMIEKKVQAALEKERQRYQQEHEQQERQSLPSKLESTYRDFNHVCTTENLDYFEYHYPEIAKAYRYMPEGFDKWSSIYQAVKRFVPQGHKEDQERMQENASKPKSVVPSMIDTKPQTAGWKLTEERKRENWARMQRERKSFS